MTDDLRRDADAAHGPCPRRARARPCRHSHRAAPRPRSSSASRSSITARPRRSTSWPSISVPEAHTIVIQPWDRSALGAIEKAILKSEVGLMPNVDGTVVRLNIPPLTEERRKDLVKLVHKRMEEARVEIRNHRRDVADEIKTPRRTATLSADEARRELESLQKVTDRWTDEVDRVGKHKEQEILEVG